MLPKELRLGKAEAKEVFMRGKSLFSSHFILKTLNSPTPNGRGFAVSVSKKVASSAVLRNRTRRRVYSVLRKLVPGIKSGWSIGISVKKGGESADFASLEKEITDLLVKSGLLKV